MPNPWEEYSSVDTATVEEQGPWNDFAETEKQGVILPPGWKPRPTAESMLMDPVTGLKRESGMEAPTGLVTAIGRDPLALVKAPLEVAGGMVATGLNLIRPSTWLPEKERERQAATFGSPLTPPQQVEAQMFQVGKPLYQPTTTALEPEGNELARLLSQWSTPESMAMLPAGMSRAGAALLLTQMVPGIVGDIKGIVTGEGTEEQKRDRINNLVSLGILAAHGAGRGKTVTETTPPVPAAEMPKTPTATGTRPAIRLVGGEVVVGDAGMTHPDIIARDKIPADKIDQRGGVDANGNFLDREQWAKVLEAQGVTPKSEVERAHSTDLPEAQESLTKITVKDVAEIESIPATENGGRIAIVLPDGTAVVGGRIHADTWNKAVESGVATDAQLSNSVAGFVKPDGTAWGVNGKPLPKVSNVFVVGNEIPKPPARPDQRPPQPIESSPPKAPPVETPPATPATPAVPAEPAIVKATTEAKPRTLTPAFKADEGEFIETGRNHGEAQIKHARQGRLATLEQNRGFLDENGNFLTRKEGAQRFKEITGKDPTDPQRLTSEDLEAEKMLGHLETPKVSEAPAPPKATIDDWITKLEALKSKGGEPGLASFPDPEVFKGIGSALRNTAIDVAIGVLKAGKSIGEALDAAMAHIRERVKDFNEPKVRAAFEAYLNPPETTGIAHRVSEARGMAPERGEGVAAADSVERGRVLLEKGLDPQAVLDLFSRTKSVRADDMAVVRAHLERLSKATNDASDTYGIDSPEYKAAWEAEKDWRAAVKPMQTEWHRIGMAQQGETDIDTGTFTGLQRAHQEKTGTDFTPSQSKRAQRIAKANKDAQNATGGAQQRLNRHLVNKSKSMTEAEKAALDAANKTVRDAAARNAEAENKARVAEEVRKQTVDKVQADAAAAAAKVQTESAKREAINRVKSENKARVAAATKAKSTADAQLKATQKALDAANKTVRDAAAKAAEKERKLQGDPILRVWTKAKEYLDKGIDNFDDIRKKLATDLGMSIEQVTRLLQQDQRAKLLADDLWRKQQKERQLKSQAKRWVQNLSTPGYLKALQSVPKIMFGLKVGFHGTVALGTHAPTVAFRPRFWAAYVRDFGKMYKMVNPFGGKGKSYYENQIQDLMRRDNYITARRAGLVNDPFVYEDFNSPDTAKYFGGLTGMGNRGYTVLKILRQDMFDQHWNQLPKSMQIPEIAQAIADGVNHATGVVQGRAPRGTNVALFAPRLEASRVMWLLGDPARAVGTLLNWKNASLGEKYFAMNQLKEKAWVMGTLGSLLALNQGVLSAIGSDQKINVTDPFKPDFLKFKVAGMNVSYGNPMITMARLPLRLFVGVENEGKLNKIVYEDENVATVLFEYVRSQMSPFAGTVTDLGIGRDYMRRPLPRAGFGLLPGKRNIPKRLRAEGIKPYTWPEYFIQQLAMIPLQEALKEVWGKDLVMDAEARERSLKALATIIVMGGTGARVSADWSVQNKATPPEEQGPWNDFK